MVSSHSIPPPITIDSRVEITKRDDPHKFRRRFIGPMPERVVSQLDSADNKQARGWRRLFSSRHANKDEDAGVRNAIREYALQFFLGQGGRTEDWGEDEERHVREEMYRRWKKTEWAQARARRREAKANKQWIGTSFDIGVFLGVDVFDATRTMQTPSQSQAGTASAVGSVSRVPTAATGNETFVTAPSMILNGNRVLNDTGSISQRMTVSRISLSLPSGNLCRPGSETSTTPLLENPPAIRVYGATDPGNSRPALRAPTDSNQTSRFLDVPRSESGRGKSVHYSDVPTPFEDPASPGEVLARSGSRIEETTSAGAAQQAVAQLTAQPEGSDVIMRGVFHSTQVVGYTDDRLNGKLDRMLVQISCTNAQSLGPNFDDSKARITPHMQYYDLSEYIVAWRNNQIELYKNYVRSFLSLSLSDFFCYSLMDSLHQERNGP